MLFFIAVQMYWSGNQKFIFVATPGTFYKNRTVDVYFEMSEFYCKANHRFSLNDLSP